MARRFFISSRHLAYAGVPGFSPSWRQAASSWAASMAATSSGVLKQAHNGSATATINKSREKRISVPPSVKLHLIDTQPGRNCVPGVAVHHSTSPSACRVLARASSLGDHLDDRDPGLQSEAETCGAAA